MKVEIEDIITKGLVPDIIIKQVQEGNHALFAKYFSWHIDNRLIQDDFKLKMNELKDVRDKALAHSEKIDKVFKIKWITFEELLHFAQKVIGIIGWAYFSTIFMDQGKYELTEYARRIEFDIISILKNLKIIKDGA